VLLWVCVGHVAARVCVCKSKAVEGMPLEQELMRVRPVPAGFGLAAHKSGAGLLEHGQWAAMTWQFCAGSPVVAQPCAPPCAAPASCPNAPRTPCAGILSCLQVQRNIPYVLVGGVPFWRRVEIQVRSAQKSRELASSCYDS